MGHPFVFFYIFVADQYTQTMADDHTINEQRIPETAFAEDLAKGLGEIAQAVGASGLTIAEIARGTRCHWETVYHASKGIPVRYDSARRILYFLEHRNG